MKHTIAAVIAAMLITAGAAAHDLETYIQNYTQEAAHEATAARIWLFLAQNTESTAARKEAAHMADFYAINAEADRDTVAKMITEQGHTAKTADEWKRMQRYAEMTAGYAKRARERADLAAAAAEQ